MGDKGTVITRAAPLLVTVTILIRRNTNHVQRMRGLIQKDLILLHAEKLRALGICLKYMWFLWSHKSLLSLMPSSIPLTSGEAQLGRCDPTRLHKSPR
jgi:hypothetical protein